MIIYTQALNLIKFVLNYFCSNGVKFIIIVSLSGFRRVSLIPSRRACFGWVTDCLFLQAIFYFLSLPMVSPQWRNISWCRHTRRERHMAYNSVKPDSPMSRAPSIWQDKQRVLSLELLHSPKSGKLIRRTWEGYFIYFRRAEGGGVGNFSERECFQRQVDFPFPKEEGAGGLLFDTFFSWLTLPFFFLCFSCAVKQLCFQSDL